ncbi:MAG: J domain-containing protein [Flavobacteriales bacterium]|nr:J domain-containing protein [Flavobacteriales bacterium]
MAKDYHKILGLEKGADASEIKSAYRTKAKMYHPDKNSHPSAEEVFILVNEAYEMLINPPKSEKGEVDPEMRKKYYGTSKAGENFEEKRKEAARKRAKANAHMSFEKFSNSPIYKTAVVMDRMYKYVFIIIGIIMVVMPLVGTHFMTEEQKKDYNYYQLIFPVLLGLVFIYGIWYFLFKNRDELG